MRKLSFALTLFAAMSFGNTTSQAQDSVPRDNVSAQTFMPAPGRGNFVVVDGTTVSGHVAPTAGLLVDYGYRPFVLYDATCAAGTSDCSIDGTRRVLTEHLATAHVMGTIALWNRLQLGIVLPLSLMSGDSFQFARGSDPIVVAPGGVGFGIGDLRINAKVNIFNNSEFGFGAVVWGTVPLGPITAEDRFIGDAGPILGGHLAGEYRSDGFRVAANVGGFWRETSTFLSTTVGPRLTYGVGASYDFTPLAGLLAEINGSASFSGQLDEHTMEGRLAARLRSGDFQFTVGGGGGILSGVGVPMFRVLAGMQWAPDHDDLDNDGVLDRLDACPTDAEDMDGFDDEDGCPEADNDNDGFLDAQDQCPDQAEDRDGYQDEDGCPDSDNDGDGILDGYDSCPSVPEDMDGDRDEDGCPDNDRDRDNIEDGVDQCPDQAEDTDGYGDEDGCPETDFDNDTLPDDQDECPDQAEDMDGFEDTDGCPEEGGPPSTTRRRR
jgi:hypothetical protein